MKTANIFMKHLYVYIMLCVTIAVTWLLVACHNYLQVMEPVNAANGGKITVSFSVSDNESKTALPVLDWNDYDFMLCAKHSSNPDAVVTSQSVNLFDEKKSVSELKRSMVLDADYYKFTLKAYLKCSTMAVLEGSTDILDLTSSGQNIYFVMKPLTGENLLGSARITLKVPKTVSYVEYTLIEGEFSKALAATSFDTINTSDSSWTADNLFYTKDFTYDSLKAGGRYFARFNMYEEKADAPGTYELVAIRIESLLIVHCLTSKSLIIVEDNQLRTYIATVSLKKDGQPWSASGKEFVLVDKYDSSVKYELSDTYGNGTFIKTSVADSDYDVFIRDIGDNTCGTDTGLDFNPKMLVAEGTSFTISYKTVNLPDDDGVDLTLAQTSPFILTGSNTDQYLYQEGASGSIEFTVGPKPGYEVIEGGITLDGTAIADENSSKEGIQLALAASDLQAIEAKQRVFGGVRLIQYSIEYWLESDESWADSYTAPAYYTVKSVPQLPDASKIIKTQTGKTFDFAGWKNTAENGSSAGQSFSAIPQGTTGSLLLKPLWKEAVYIVTGDSEAGVEGAVYCNGYSLIVKYKDSGRTWTDIYYDYNGNGIIDGDDASIDETINFNNYRLVALNADLTVPASDVNFTLTGGKLSSVEGSGSGSNSITTVNISGEDTVVGNMSSNGIKLDTLTNKKVYFNGELKNNYSITLIAADKFRAGSSSNDLALITAPSYAPTLNKVTCLYWETSPSAIDSYNAKYGTSYPTSTARYLSQEIAVDAAKTKINLVNSDPINLPDASDPDSGIIWDPHSNGAEDTEFQLGDNALVSIPCSVFSITVENGTFTIGQTALKTESGSQLSTDNLVQTAVDSYSTTTALNTQYIYLHMLSKTDEITPSRATEFLKGVTFIKDSASTPITIRVNLETVPYSQITAFVNSQGASVDNFKYYDGSFYLWKNDTVAWDTAYNRAKAMTFNGLSGYLMTITSQVENNYIVNELKATQAWIGGSRHIPLNGFDAGTYSYSANGDIFYWQCGPEAGQVFWEHPTRSYKSGRNTVEYQAPEGVYVNWESGEPNNLSLSILGGPKLQDCVQFMSTGWNDINNSGNTALGILKPESFIVEFRPYKTSYGTQTASNQSVSLRATYQK